VTLLKLYQLHVCLKLDYERLYCVCFCLVCRNRTVDRTAFILGSFESFTPSSNGLKSFVMSRDLDLFIYLVPK